MNKESKSEADERLRKWRENCQNSLLEFGRAIYPDYVWSRHIQEIISTLEKVERGDIDRLMITMPPRHGKSTLASQLFPAWYIGRNPKKYIIFSSTGELAVDFGGWVRDCINSEIFQEIFPECKLKQDTQSRTRFHTTKGGQLLFSTIGARINGKGAHLFLIDDPVGHTQDADSVKGNKMLMTWYREIAITRLMPQAAMVIISTRFRYNDLIGELLSTRDGAKISNWHKLNFPAIAEEDGQDWRKKGEALWPERYDIQKLERIQETETMGRAWYALYQQKPAPDTGNLFTDEHFIECDAKELKLVGNKIMFADTATSDKTTADFSAIVMAVCTEDKKIVILDCWRKRCNFPELLEWIRDHAVFHKVNVIYVEDASSGRQVWQTMQKYSPIPVVPVKVEKGKVERANVVLPYADAKRILFHSPVSHDLKLELLTFPYGANDDLADAFIGACTALIHNRFGRPKNRGGGRLPIGWFGR